jgi:hypothetical protein
MKTQEEPMMSFQARRWECIKEVVLTWSGVEEGKSEI